jgi:hypothetical protein
MRVRLLVPQRTIPLPAIPLPRYSPRHNRTWNGVGKLVHQAFEQRQRQAANGIVFAWTRLLGRVLLFEHPKLIRGLHDRSPCQISIGANRP